MTVEAMIDDVARTIWDHMDYGGVPSRMPQWVDQGPVTGAKYRRRAEAALKSLGIPLETLAALASGAWKAVPVECDDSMYNAAVRAQDHDGDGDVWAAMLAAAPAKPGDE